MAVMGLLTIDPFQSIANSASSFSNLVDNSNIFTITHTGITAESSLGLVVDKLEKLKSLHKNLLCLNSSTIKSGDILNNSTLINTSGSELSDNFRILYKGRIKVGIISINAHSESFDKANELASFLKNDKKCDIVICQSNIGFNSSDNFDDSNLAANSAHIDVIAGDNMNNHSIQPNVLKNKNGADVILYYTGENGLSTHSIEIGFDDSGNKNYLNFKRVR